MWLCYNLYKNWIEKNVLRIPVEIEASPQQIIVGTSDRIGIINFKRKIPQESFLHLF